MHLMHTLFAFGGLIGPIISRPFISEYHFAENIISNQTSCVFNDKIIFDSQEDINKIFYIVGASSCFIGLVALTEIIFSHFSNEKKPKEEDTEKTSDEKTKIEKRFDREIAAFLSLFFCFYVGAEWLFANYIYSYSICRL